VVDVEFADGSRLVREADRPSQLPIVGNGPPGTFVVFPGHLRVSLPTDQIVETDESGGRVRVRFGGMQFAGVDENRLLFFRVRELYPETQLSPARSHTMTLAPEWVASVIADGRRVWPSPV
jgi:hypothetical protein